MTTEPTNDALRMRKSIERGIMGRVVLCFACVCITNIQQMAGEDCHYECFLSPSGWIWLHILFQNKQLSLCKVRPFSFNFSLLSLAVFSYSQKLLVLVE